MAVGIRLVVASHLGTVFPSFGTREFFWIAIRDGRPYRDFAVEYPIVMFGVIKGIAQLAPGLTDFSRSVIWLNFGLDIVTAVVILRTWGRDAAAFYAIAGLPLVGLVYGTLDSLSVCAAVIAVALWVKGRPASSGSLLAVATFAKLWPGPLILVARRIRTSDRDRRLVITAAALGAGLTIIWLALGGIDGIRQVISYRGATGWEIESTPGLVLLASHGASAVYGESGAARIGEVTSIARITMLALSLGISSWSVLRGQRVALLGLGWLTATTSLLIFSALLSPQFVFWLLPAAAITWTEARRAVAVVVAASAALTGLEMLHWEWIVEAHGGWLALLALRNVLLIVVLCLGVIGLYRAEVVEGHARYDIRGTI